MQNCVMWKYLVKKSKNKEWNYEWHETRNLTIMSSGSSLWVWVKNEYRYRMWMCEYNPNGVARKRWKGQHLWSQKPRMACTHLLTPIVHLNLNFCENLCFAHSWKICGKRQRVTERLEEMEITQLPLSPYFYINLYYLDLEIKIHLL
jgi:hypothetical protein